MSQVLTDQLPTLADLVSDLGDIPLKRVLAVPFPGSATVEDVVHAANLPRKRLCELIDGVLVEKAMGAPESLLAGWLLTQIWNYLAENNIGVALGEAGMVQILPNQVRIPDVSFLSWKHFPTRQVPREPVWDVAPDLAVEVLSRSNTPKEMTLKIDQYFESGVKLVWIVDPEKELADVYHSPTEKTQLDSSMSLDGEDILPGLAISLTELFSKGK